MRAIDWTDPRCSISKFFSVREALWLPTWNKLASAGDGLNKEAEDALVFLFEKMDVVREFIGIPIFVHVAYRPVAYNTEIGGAKDSAHIARAGNIAAVDWSSVVVSDMSPGENCDTLRQAIEPMLEQWGLRCEENPPGSPWIHLDTMPVPEGGHRVFLP